MISADHVDRTKWGASNCCNRLGRRRQRGQGILEYSLGLALIALVVIGLVQRVGTQTNSALCQTSTGLNSNRGGCSASAWGAGTLAELGNGGTSDSPTAVQVSNLTTLSSIAAGYVHS